MTTNHEGDAMKAKHSTERRFEGNAKADRIFQLAKRLGFTSEKEGFANYVMGWTRAYNLSSTEQGKIYNAGAMGIQINWRVTQEGEVIGTIQTWRN